MVNIEDLIGQHPIRILNPAKSAALSKFLHGGELFTIEIQCVIFRLSMFGFIDICNRQKIKGGSLSQRKRNAWDKRKIR